MSGQREEVRKAGMVAVLLVVDSMHFVFARMLRPYLPPQTSAMLVLTVAALEVALFLAVRRQIQWAVLHQHARFFLTIGFLVALATTLSYTAVQYVDAGTASLLAQMSTVFALGFSFFWLKERLNRQEGAGAFLALVGVFTISFQPGAGVFLQIGSLLVLGSAFAYALHTAVVKRHGGQMDFANFFLFRVAATSGFLILFTLGRGQLEMPADWWVWLLVVLVATVDVVVSRVLYYLALRRLRLNFHAILLTLSPVLATFWSLLLFAERPSLQGVAGGVVVIAGVLVVTQARRGAGDEMNP